MNESILFREIRTEATARTFRDVIERILRAKLSGDALSTALALVANQKNVDQLSRWFDLAQTLSPEALLAELAN